MPTIDRQRRLVAFHAPKTGSNHVLRIMEAHGAQRFNGHHDSVQMHQWASTGHWQPFGTVRDPWRWYCSWYLHARSKHTGPSGIPGYGATFREALAVATSVRGAWQDNGSRAGVFYTLQPLDPALAFFGLCSATLTSVYWPAPPWRYGSRLKMIPTDRLNEGLAELLDIEVEGATNTAAQRGDSTDYSAWYDAVMLDWVAAADAPLIQRFGFEPFTPAPRSVYP